MKVPSHEGPSDFDMQNMNNMPPMGDDMMGNQDPNMQDPNMDMQPQDAEFDGDVQGGDGEAPDKKEIQKLSGQLSQKLNDYNMDDADELTKYVVGMILKQASKKMSDEDKQDAIKKLEGDEQDEDDEDMDMPKNESRMFINKKIDEVLNGDDSQYEISGEDLRPNKKKYKNPFISSRK